MTKSIVFAPSESFTLAKRIEVGTEFTDERFLYRVWKLQSIEGTDIALARFYRVNKRTGHSFGNSRAMSVEQVLKWHTIIERRNDDDKAN